MDLFKNIDSLSDKSGNITISLKIAFAVYLGFSDFFAIAGNISNKETSSSLSGYIYSYFRLDNLFLWASIGEVILAAFFLVYILPWCVYCINIIVNEKIRRDKTYRDLIVTSDIDPRWVSEFITFRKNTHKYNALLNELQIGRSPNHHLLSNPFYEANRIIDVTDGSVSFTKKGLYYVREMYNDIEEMSKVDDKKTLNNNLPY